MTTILIVEDNSDWSAILSRLMTEQGYSVQCVSDCDKAKLSLQTREVHLALIDINLSNSLREKDKSLSSMTSAYISSPENCVVGEEGFHLVAWISSYHPEVGSIILTDRSDIKDQILGRDLGADDYALKPVQPQDLQARVRSLLRRLGIKEIRTVVFGNWEFDLDNRVLKRIGLAGSSFIVELNESEGKALRLLTNRIGSIVSRSTLCTFIFDRALGDKDRSVDNIVSKLRNKLDDGLASKFSHITTVHGSGYRLEAFVVGR